MNTKSARMNGLEVSVCGEHELPEFADQRITHVVSIWDGHEAENVERRNDVHAVFPAARTHFAFFDDLLSDPTANYAPSLEAVRSILDFTTALPPGSRLLVHCKMGVSRSTAIALATLCHHAGPGHETACLHALMKIRPFASPNPMIVDFADVILGRNGALAAAIEGHSITPAEPFVLDIDLDP